MAGDNGTSDNDTDAPEHAVLLQDIVSAQHRAAKATYLEAKKEFSDECYPLLAAMVEHFAERFERMEVAIDALADEQGSLIQGDLARQLFATLDLAKTLAEAVVSAQKLDELTHKRLQQIAAAYLTAHEMTVEALDDVTIDEAGDVAGDDAEEAVGEDAEEADDGADAEAASAADAGDTK